MTEILEVSVNGGNINGFTGINFKNVEDGKTEDELAAKLRDCLNSSKPSSEGGRRRKRRTKVKSKKRANRRRRTRYQH